ncbi:glycosyltransferase family 2 protein [soil metagenome]
MEETSARPFVTIAIVCSDDETHIEACLRCATTQDYPAELLEIVVADAMSMDATRELVLRVAEEDPRVRMIDTAQRTRAAGLNAILRAGRGEIVVPMDPGGEYGRTHVTKCVEALAGSPADHVAIVPRITGRTLVERALSAVQQTRLAFAAGTELARGAEAVPTLLGAVRRRVFERVGLFDPGTKVEEDVELSQRITRAGGAVTVRRDIVVHKTDVHSFRGLFARHYQLGKGRARRTVKERKLTSIRELGPLAVVAVGGALAATSSIQPITPFALAAYALLTGAAAVRASSGEGFVTIPVAWAAYPVMHVAHGVGFAGGLVRAVVRPDWEAPPRLDEPAPA